MTFDSSARNPVHPDPEQPGPVHRSPEPVRPVWTRPPTRTRVGAIALAVTGLTIAGFSVLLVFVYLASFLGPARLGASALLALIPLTAVLLAIRWIDRWEPEPRPVLWFAFLWGAGVAVVTALIFDLGVQLTVRASGGALAANDMLSAIVQAPIVEESAKGLGVLLLFWAARKHFDGPVDGIVYGATIAGGFAFSENIQYFGTAMTDGSEATLGLTFLLRAVFSPFAHVMFTACIGLALGLAARRSGTVAAIPFLLLGLIPAVVLHSLWNGAFTLLGGDTSPVIYYFLVQVPLFIGAIVVVNMLRRQEVIVTRARLGDYAAAGWFTPDEVAMLATASGRRQARAWASRQPPGRRRAMRRFITDATRLAFARQRMLRSAGGPVNRTGEAELLARVSAHRAIVLG